MDFPDSYKDIPHDFPHLRGIKVILKQDDKKQLDPRTFSAYTIEIDIIELYPMETLLRILRRVLKSLQDKCLTI